MGSTGRVPGFFNYIIYIFIGQHGTIARPVTSGQWLLAMWHPATLHPPNDIRQWSAMFFNYIIYIYIYIYIHWPKRHGHSANDIRPSDSRPLHPPLECRFSIYYIYIYMFIGQNDTTIQPMTSGPVTSDHVASIIRVPFLQSIIYIYIFIGQNDTTIQPMTSGPATSGPATSGHVTSSLGCRFYNLLYIYIFIG